MEYRIFVLDVRSGASKELLNESLCEVKDPIELLRILSRLNCNAHRYGIVYYVEFPEVA